MFFISASPKRFTGATLAIVPGDPERGKIAALDGPVKLASHREFTSRRAELDGKSVICLLYRYRRPVNVHRR